MQGELFHISGRVQGVGFRYFTENQARRIGLKGYVRNLPDGRVETAAAGTSEQMEEFLRALKKGPPFSKVETVASGGMVELGDASDFRITV